MREIIEKLKDFIEKNGYLPYSSKVCSDNDLVDFVQYVRGKYKRGSLSEDIAEQLNDIYGHDFFAPLCDIKWVHTYSLLKDYIGEYKKLPEEGTEYKGNNLYRFCIKQIKDKDLALWKSEMLSDLSYWRETWRYTYGTSWDKSYYLLVEYVKSSNAENIERDLVYKGHNLGIWFWESVKEYLSGEMSTAEHKKLLMQIKCFKEIVLEREKEWDKNFKQLKEKSKKPDEVYLSTELWVWYITQIKRLKQKKLDTTKAKKIRDLHINISTREEAKEAAWRDAYACLLDYAKKQGSEYVSITSGTNHNGLNIGKWYYLQLGGKDKLSKDQSVLWDRMQTEYKFVTGIDTLRRKQRKIWKYRYDLLCEFYDKYGEIPKSGDNYKYKNENIGAWYIAQKGRLKGGRLDKDTANLITQFMEMAGDLEREGKDEHWETMYSSCRDYILREHKVPDSSVEVNGQGLRRWFYNNKRSSIDYRRKKMEDLLNLLNTDLWQTNYEHIKEFVGLNGRLPNHKEKFEYDWVYRQRKSKRSGKLTDAQWELLKELGVTELKDRNNKEKVISERWYENYELCKKCVEENGEALNDYNGKDINAWLRWCREYKEQGELKEEQIKLLNKLNIDWEINTHDKNWSANIKLLEDYIKENGKIPKYNSTYKGNSIGVWYMNTRRYARKGSLAENQLKDLQELGIIIEKRQDWKEKLNLLKCYMSETNKFPERKDFYRSFPLGEWVYSLQIKYEKNVLPADLAHELDKIGAIDVFKARDSRDNRWETKCDLVSDYVKEIGGLPTVNTIYKGVKLGSWISKQRQYCKAGKFSQSRVKRLEDLGIVKIAN